MGPCTWPVSYASCAVCTPLTNLPAPDQASFEAMAVEFLWRWTGQQFGICSVVLRPCRADVSCIGWSTFWGRGPYPWGSGAGSWPALVGGKWYNLRGCGCLGACSCEVPHSLELPGPVSAVTEILIDGVVLDPGAYRLDGNLLIRTDGQDWPMCQDLSLDPTQVGTWQVTYDFGQEVPLGGQLAAGVLACELAKAACRDASCALPQRIQTITRQGVTVAMLDPFTGIEKGFTGIWLIDSWVMSITAPRRASRVYSPDVPRRSGAKRISSV